MKILSLKLNNIRSHTNTELDFSESTLLIGDIGSGKSTILQAIEFGLFGSQRGYLESNHLLRKGCDQGFVEIKIKTDTEITIKRNLKRKKTSVSQDSGYLEINGKKEEFMPAELKTRVSALLGYPEKYSNLIYRYSVYATQEQMKSIILEKPESRLDTLRIIFGIDKYKKIIDNSQIINKILRKKIAYDQGKIEDLTKIKSELAEIKINLNEIQSQKKQHEKTVENTKEKLNQADKNNNQIQEKFNEIQIKITKYENFKQQNKKNQDEIKKYEENIDNLEKEIQNMMHDSSSIIIPQLNESYQEIKEKTNSQKELINRNEILKNNIKEKIEDKNKRISEIKKEIEDIEIEIKNKKEMIIFKEKIQEEIKECKEITSKKSIFEKQLSEKKTEFAKLSSELNLNNEQKENINNISTCPTCKQKVREDYKNEISLTIENKNKKIKENLEIINKDISILENKIEEVKNKEIKEKNLEKNFIKIILNLEEITKKEISFNNKKEILTEIEKELENLLKKSKIINEFNFQEQENILKELEKKYEEHRKIEILKEKKNNLFEKIKDRNKLLSDYSNTIKKIKTENIEIKNSLDLLENINSENEKYAIKLKESKEILSQLREDYEKEMIYYEKLKTEEINIIKFKESLEKQINDKEKTKLEIDFKENTKSWINNFMCPLMKKIENLIFYQIYSDFNQRFQNWFDMLIEDDSLSVYIDEQFTPKIIQNGYDMDIDSLSGGERTSVALAYRLALNKIVAELIGINTKDVLILDEPTEGFSTEQLDRVRDVLFQLKIPQIIIVSHEQKMDGFVNKVIKVEKVEGESRLNW